MIGQSGLPCDAFDQGPGGVTLTMRAPWICLPRGATYASLMDITHFDDLLKAARLQATPQRLLLVFAGASLPELASAEQRASFDVGKGGELAPLMCVDKGPHELADFSALAAEAATLGPPWVLVFAAAMDGIGMLPPTPAAVDAALQGMVEAVRGGDIGRFIPFDTQGQAVRLD